MARVAARRGGTAEGRGGAACQQEGGGGRAKWENVSPVDGKEVLDAAMIGLRNGHVVRARRRS